ncbi:hypothetical protein GKD41_02200 [Odoribacter splanchnicus]|uniref:Glycosyl hydrolase family 92 domain-containing protein n=2 Tax=Odoribacter splanchnicus TaxID=28118 RepID=A0A412W6G6_9BACT|nr:hypothetical protein [Odoribacter sp.]MBT9661497.1 hypothetical protein [Odoribacter splanchnicus]MBV4277155.1 glycoside hydrolase family 92 protein [Odoribacter splanchnicus]MBV4292481.1 glycoside hydrolase family 92 protein [Odoribacter splanchnicus]MRZ84957.1 hypothetical protein [Odoribacter splanchnicus]
MPHDIEGMKALRGEVFFIQELELFFDRTTKDFLWSDYYNHPNEPDHHVPFLFNYSSKPYTNRPVLSSMKLC